MSEQLSLSTVVDIDSPQVEIEPECIMLKQDVSNIRPQDEVIDERERLKRLRKLKRQLEQANALEQLIHCHVQFETHFNVENDCEWQEQPSVQDERGAEISDNPLEVCVQKDNDKEENTYQYICEFCGQLFSCMKNMLRHMEGYHAIPGTSFKRGNKFFFKCQFCALEFPARSQLFRHCNQTHGDQVKGTYDKNTEHTSRPNMKLGNSSISQSRTCIHCNIKMDSFEEFVSHLKKVHAETFCDICYRVFQDLSFLLLHRRVHFAGNPFACDICPKVFKSLQHVGEHRRGHTGDKPYRCTQCPLGFARIGDLNRHTKLRHTEEPSYACSICSQTFHSSSLYHRHKQKHQKAAEMGVGANRLEIFPCKSCGEMFANGNDRKEHELVSHSEGRPFGCEVCGKRFKMSGHLKAHMFTHTGVKSQKCDQCSAAFYLAGDLRRHQKTHQKLVNSS